MALRVIRLFVPTGATAFRVGSSVQTAGIHTTTVNNLRYGYLAFLLGERTTPKLKEHSKIITIDGNMASGKGVLAKKLADKLGMHHLPGPDTFYLDKRGKESEALDVRFNGNCSLEKFYTDPKASDGNSYRLQFWMYLMRLLQYSDALEHLLATGQGVVLERSPFSDIVFLEAMFQQGYIRTECVQHYNEIKGITLCDYLPPHLVIYVDSPVEDVQQKLKASGKPYLQNVSVPYLKCIEKEYKKTFLPQISEKAELLAYDATYAQDVDRVVEDIDNLKFEKGPWTGQDDVTYHYMRMLVEDKQRVISMACIPKYLPEVTVGAHDHDANYYAYKSLPGKRYAEGYNADVGDKNIWLK